MPRRRLRVALATALLAPLLLAPVVAHALSTAVGCPDAGRDGPWQILPVEAFRGTEGVSTRDVVTGYAVDSSRPQRVLATNGNTVKTSGSYGCAWEDGLVLDAAPDEAVPVSGTTSTVVSVALLPGGAALAAIREGTGAASRPHVAVSRSGERGSWRFADAGLPVQGAPRLLEAAGDGRTAYLVMSAIADGGTSGGTLPGLPSAPPAGDAAGSLYATTNGGGSWELRTPAGELPADGVTGLSVDPTDPSLLYLVSGERLLVSRDGGRTLRDAGLSGVRAVEAMEPREVAVAQDVGPETGLIQHSRDGGASFSPRASARGLDSLGYRRGDGMLVGEGNGRLLRIDARRDAPPEPVRIPLQPTRGTALGDRGSSPSYTVLAEHAILRWVDLTAGRTPPPPPVVGDLAAPPPPPGRVEPAVQAVTMPVGETRLLDYRLVLSPSPTPVDVMFLVDTSPSMTPYIEELRENLRRIATTLAGAGVDVKIGLATAGPGPADGEPPYPEVKPGDPSYRKPALYRLLRPIGPVDRQLQEALEGVRTDSGNQSGGNQEVLEGQLASLRQLVVGDGVEEELSTPGAPRYAVQPGQKAGFRPQLGIRRLVIHATDEPFNNPYGTPRRADGTPDLEGVGRLLRDNRVQQAGISPIEGGRSLPDLRTMALLTGARVPSTGLDCTNGVVLEPGDPLVCQTSAGFSRVITGLVRELVDLQDAAFAAVDRTPVLGSVDASALRAVDVTQANALPVRVRVSCLDAAAGTYEQRFRATLRGFEVASASATVTCTPAPVAAAVPPRPDPPQVQEPAPPAGQPAAQAPAPPAPAPPVVQPQPQPQAQSQVQSQVQPQPLAAAALEQQEQLQLALALSGDLAADEAPRTELAMVDRRRGEQLRALALLSVSMGAASAFGLARLRTRREPSLRVRRGR